MDTISNHNLVSQIREKAALRINETGHHQPAELFFVQFDDHDAVGSDGCIYQINTIEEIENLIEYDEDYKPLLIYTSENYAYNYAEDQPKFDDPEDRKIFQNCKRQAELLAEE